MTVTLIPVAPFLKIVKIMLLVAMTWLIRLYIDKRDMASLGFTFHRGWSRDILLGLGLGAFLMSCIFIVELIFGWKWDSSHHEFLEPANSLNGVAFQPKQNETF